MKKTKFLLFFLFFINAKLLSQHQIELSEIGLRNYHWYSSIDARASMAAPNYDTTTLAFRDCKSRLKAEELKKEQVVYWDSSKVVLWSLNTKKGKHIKHQQFFQNGKIQFDVMLKQIPSGDTIAMFDPKIDRDRIEKIPYFSEILDGIFIEYNSNGTIKQKGKYIENQKTGKWIFNNQNGQKISEGNYKILIIKEKSKCLDMTTYYEIDCTKEIRKEIKQGKWIFYKENGEIQEEIDYK
jgi:antitoxin component YwqK of YwqJK toxin-antitoxin module